MSDDTTREVVDLAWVARAVANASDGDLAIGGQSAIADAVTRLDALLRAWAAGFASRRPDVAFSELTHGRRGLHPDECASFLRALDARLLHVDSAGYVVPLCATAKPGQTPYALCCKNGDAVGVNLEYIIQLGVLAELATVHGWPTDRLWMELGEFDAAVRDETGRAIVLVEAKARASGPDSLEKLLTKWLAFSSGPVPSRGENAANKYLELMAATTARGHVNVLLAAAGVRWWLTAERAPEGLLFATCDPPMVNVHAGWGA